MAVTENIKPILIIEDEAIMRDSLRDWLTDAGYQVETAEDGEKALEALRRLEFGLLIVDLRLPGQDGIEILRQARMTNDQLKGIVMTAYPSVDTALEALKEGAIDYFTKPCDLNQLEESVRNILGPAQIEIRPRDETQSSISEEPPASIPVHIRNNRSPSLLIQMLLAIQQQNSWLPQDALVWVSQQLGVPLTKIYAIATFYKAFSLKPQGRHVVTVCLGTACHVRGAPRLIDKVTELLKIKPGNTTRDQEFSLKTVNCLGCCALGPVLMIDDTYYSNPSSEELKELFDACRQEKEAGVR